MIPAPRRPSMRIAATLAGLLSLECTVVTGTAFAGPAEDKALATDLFDKGIKKMEAGKCDEQPISDAAACREARELFRKAYEVYPTGLGALRNLAYVERGLGMYASAARSFRELERKAPEDPNPKRHVWAEFARKELETIEPLVPKMTLVVPADRPADLVVTVDGTKVPSAVWGTALDYDPGEHVVRGEAAGRPPFEAKVMLADKDAKTVEVTFAVVAPPKPPDPPKPRSRTLPLVVAGVGGVTVVVGLVFGATAISKRKDACGDGHYCNPVGLDDAKSAAATSNVVTGVGAAVLAGGLLWYFLTPKAPPAAPGAETPTARVLPWGSPSGGGLAAVGTF